MNIISFADPFRACQMVAETLQMEWHVRWVNIITLGCALKVNVLALAACPCYPTSILHLYGACRGD